MTSLRHYIDRLVRVCDHLDIAALDRARDRIVEVLASGRHVYIAGNGGSAANAAHWANDLRAAAQSLNWCPAHVQSLASNTAQLTALANDEGYEQVFARALEASAQAGDLLIVLSASGNSPNILRALESARSRGMLTIGFLGMGGGTARSLCDHAVVVDSDDYGPVEDLHLICDHAISDYIRALPPRIA